jgi:hypothetical protein
MPQLEPTYFRYIFDGLMKGNIHPENAAELPDGQIRFYEEAIKERSLMVSRNKLLLFIFILFSYLSKIKYYLKKQKLKNQLP